MAKRTDPVSGLNDRQERFCREYIIDLNGTQAAIRSGYSARAAKQTAARLLTQANILARVLQLQDERNDRLEVDADWVLQELLGLYQADIRSFYGEEGQMLTPHELAPHAARRVTSIESEQLYEWDPHDKEKVPAGVAKKLKIAPPDKLIEMIGRHVNIGAWKQVALTVEPLVYFHNYAGPSGQTGDENDGDS